MSAVQMRNQHKELRSQIGDARQELAEQRRGTARLREEMVDNPSREQAARLTASINAESELQTRLDGLREQELGNLRQFGSAGVGGVDLGAALGDRLGDPAFQVELARMAHSSAHLGDVVIGEIPREDVAAWAGRALAAATGTVTGPTAVPAAPQQIVPLPTPAPRFLDLLPSGTTDGPSVPFAQEVSAQGGPAPTPPGALKPAVDFAYQDEDAGVGTIAGWTKVQRQSLADVPALQAVIQTRLLARLQVALESEVLSGDGSVSDRTGKKGIVGLLETQGLASVPVASGESVVDAVLDAIVAVNTVGNANVCAMNITDWADLMRARDGDQRYLSNPFAGTPARLWGLVMTPAVGVPPGKLIVGDSSGAALLIREGAQIRVSDADSDDFLRNRVTVLAEVRAALAVWIPSYFAVVELA